MFRKILNSDFVSRICEVIDRRSENRMTEYGMLAQAFEFAKINGVQGAYFEFGVWRGKTFCAARRMARRYNVDGVKFYAFDSFRGLPRVEKSKFEIWSEGQFAFGESEFEAVLKGAGFGRDEYRLVPGFYDESLSDELVAELSREGVKARVVYIDCDLYESTVPVLRFIRHFVQTGTVVCFDDYFNYRALPDRGEQLALREFLAQHPQIRMTPFMAYSPLGMSFVANCE